MNRHATLQAHSSEDHREASKDFFLSYHTEKIKGEIDERLYKETSCQRQTGRKTERQANRQCSSLLW